MAIKALAISGPLGSTMATRSPRPMPMAFRLEMVRCASSRNPLCVSAARCGAPMAGALSRAGGINSLIVLVGYRLDIRASPNRIVLCRKVKNIAAAGTAIQRNSCGKLLRVIAGNHGGEHGNGGFRRGQRTSGPLAPADYRHHLHGDDRQPA